MKLLPKTDIVPKVSNKKLAIALGAAVAVVGVSGVVFWRGGKADNAPLVVEPVVTSLQTAPESTEPVYVHYVALANAAQNYAITADDIKRLHVIGSLKGMLTTQFKQATHAKMTYRFGRRQKLAFEPVRPAILASQGFVLTGREYEGNLINGAYQSLYRLFENPISKARIEIFETRITADQPVEMIAETLNESVLGVPVSLERFTDKKGVVYHSATFVAKDRYYVINTKAVDRQLLIDVLQQIVEGVV